MEVSKIYGADYSLGAAAHIGLHKPTVKRIFGKEGKRERQSTKIKIKKHR